MLDLVSGVSAWADPSNALWASQSSAAVRRVRRLASAITTMGHQGWRRRAAGSGTDVIARTIAAKHRLGTLLKLATLVARCVA